ncbi:MAG: ABC transporter ATP-binding protein [Desulfobulbaceae bacterium]|nr:ABC transporter ATP-binding protein [Desulfobulbaceae bacterium]
MNTSANQPELSVQALSVGYSSTPVLRDLHFVCERGQFISLLGPNGAGKTTLLRTLSRHLPPLSGAIQVRGKSLKALGSLELARIMAVVLTDKITPPLLTVEEFVALGRYPHTDYLGRLRQVDKVRIHAALNDVHAGALRQRQFSDLSDGERQKVLIARALAQEPQLLLLDEPTIHLDLRHRIEVMAILRDLCREQGITVLASLHDVDVAAKISDRVALIKNGGMMAWGAPESIINAATVAELYNLEQAVFDSALGGLEIRGPSTGSRVFVLGGMGSGAGVYRMLAKKGFAISTGVLQEHDLDFHVARALGAECISVAPTETVNGLSTEQALQVLLACDFVVDSGFSVGPANRANLDLLATALARGKTVLSLREEKAPVLAGGSSANLYTCRNADQFLHLLDSTMLTSPIPLEEHA